MSLRVVDVGRAVSYADGLRVMRDAMARIDSEGPVLLLLEHAPVITTTRRGGSSFVVTPKEEIERDGIDVVETDRGGDVTFHGPGQLVGYPIVRLGPTSLGGDLVGYVRAMEESLIAACAQLGVQAPHRMEGMTGVWCDAPIVEQISCGLHDVTRGDCKLVAIGVGVSGGVTRHGFALNITTELERFTRHIVPCGLVGRGVTSLERLLPRPPSFDVVKDVVAAHVGARLAAWHRPLTAGAAA